MKRLWRNYEGWRMWRNYSPHIWTVGFGKILSSSHWVGGGKREKKHETCQCQVIKYNHSSIPPWLFSPLPVADLFLTQYRKSSTPSHIYKHLFNELTHKFNSPTLCFTDGSKFHKISGHAFLVGSSCHSYRHRNSASIFTTELQAIHHCLQHILSSVPPPGSNPFLIISDSLSSLISIRKPSLTHPLISHIHLLLQACKAFSIPLTFVRSPSHTGITGNEQVDQAAKQAVHLRTLHKSWLPDLTSLIKSTIYRNWTDEWKKNTAHQATCLRVSKNSQNSSNQPNCFDEIILTRLRIGHTRLTHTHLLSHLHPFSRLHCNNDLPLSIDHIFLRSHLANSRLIHNIPKDRLSAFNNNSPSILKLIPFFRDISLLKHI